MQEVILFYNGLDVPTRQILDSKDAIPSKTAADDKIAIQEMAKYSQKWHNGTSSRTRSTEIFDGLAAFLAQLNNLGREIKKVNEKVYTAQMRKVLQERGFGTLPSSMEINPQDQVKLISTTKADFSKIRHIGCGTYAILGTQHRSILSEIVPFPRRLQNFSCDDWREAQDVKILDDYDHNLP
ncbi:hypothetical protein Tco_1127185 [Tanacetum coccineum]